MTFAGLSWPLVLGGLGVLAGLLFLLQRLRVRYREQTVITTLFWKQALEEARARVLVRRFKHFLAYLLALAIAALLWLGFADPEFGDRGERDHLLLLDGSANMARGDRFARTVELVQTRVAALPHQRRRVVLCADHPRTLLANGEHARLLAARLADFAPIAGPASVDRVLQRLTTDRATQVLIAGDAPVRPATLAALPPHIEVVRLTPAAAAAAGNHGITVLGAGRARSGDFEKVDVLCEVTGPDPAPPLTVELAGRPLAQTAERTTVDGRTRWVLRDLPANGTLLTLSLPGGDALAADDRATLRLPERRRIRVALSDSLQDTCGPVLRADPAILLTDSDPQVVVRRTGEPGPAVPTLEFVASASQHEAILLRHRAGRSSHQVLLESLATLGLSEVDAMEAAESSGRRIELGATPAPRRGIGVWAALLAAPFNLVQSRSFPVFIAQSVRWLAEVRDDPEFVAAGHPLANRSQGAALIDARGRKLDPVGADFVPPAAGVYRRDGQVALAAALTDAATTTPPADSPVAAAGPVDTAGFDLGLWLAAAVLALLLLEWFLFRTGRMP